MSDMNFTINGGSTIRLKTAGKYCTQDILVTATGGVDNLDAVLTNTLTKVESNVEKLTNYALYKRSSLTEVILPEVTEIGDYALGDCDGLTVLQFPKLVKVGNSAFENSGYLVEVDCPLLANTSAKSFYGCNRLDHIVLPNAKVIAANTFYNCGKLTYAVLPSATSIGANAFYKCTSLAYIDFSGCTAVPTLSSTNAFTNVPATCQFRVPASLCDEWKAAKNWSTYADMIVAVE